MASFSERINPNYVVVLLIAIAILVGGLVAIQGSNFATLSDHNRRIEVIASEVKKLQTEFTDRNKIIELDKVQQQNLLLDLSKQLNLIQVEQAKKGKR